MQLDSGQTCLNRLLTAVPAVGLARVLHSTPTSKTMDPAQYDTHLAHVMGRPRILQRLLKFWQRSDVKRMRFDAYVRRQKAYHATCRQVSVPTGRARCQHSIVCLVWAPSCGCLRAARYS